MRKTPFRDAFDYFFDCTNPNEDYAPDGCSSALIIVVGSTDWAEDIERLAKEATKPIGKKKSRKTRP